MAMAVLVVAQGVLILLLYRHFGMMAMGTMEGVQRDGLGVGESAPDISGVTAEGRDVLWKTATGRAQVLFFATPGCEPCGDVMPYIGQLAGDAERGIEVAVIVPGPVDVAREMVGDYGTGFACLAEDGSGAFDKYRVRVTPFAFLVGDDGSILSKGLCSSPVMLQNLLVAGGKEAPAELLEPSIQVLRDRSSAKGVSV